MRNLVTIFLLFASINLFGQVPINDRSNDYIPITTEGCVEGTTVGADDDLSGCLGCQTYNCGQHHEVWYLFVATSTEYSFNLYSSDLAHIEILIFKYGDDDDNYAVLDDPKYTKCGLPTLSGTYNGLDVGDFYLIAISSENKAEGEFLLCSNTALAVELSEFVLIKGDNENIVKWVTLSETNTDYYLIEKSSDGINYDMVGSVQGNGTTSNRQNYLFTDDTIKEQLNYYRLTEIEVDGSQEILIVDVIDNSTDKVELVGIYNIYGQEISGDEVGLQIYRYSDGTNIKIFKNS